MGRHAQHGDDKTSPIATNVRGSAYFLLPSFRRGRRGSELYVDLDHGREETVFRCFLVLRSCMGKCHHDWNYSFDEIDEGVILTAVDEIPS